MLMFDGLQFTHAVNEGVSVVLDGQGQKGKLGLVW